jgi:hypothetical protein
MTDPTHNHKLFTIKVGDLLPSIEILLVDCQGKPLNLEPYEKIEVVIAACVGGRRIVSMAPAVVKNPPGTDGLVVYDWQPGQTDKPGDFQLEVILTLTDPNAVPQSKLMTLPGGGYGRVKIVPRL